METQTQRAGYRPEIDGLRAIAVVAVVLFHAGIGFSGGYVGVDVFFVISGFLITTIVAKELDAGCFSLQQFWARRIRRILPASAVMVGVVAIAGFFLLLPSDFENIMGSAFWHAAMLANYYFCQDVGYFAERAEFKPLLHTWSLAVEEQFYIVYPPLLVCYRRYVSKNLLPAVVAIAVASLLMSIWQTPSNEAAAFFLLPARAWELLAGALLAFLSLDFLKNKFAAESVSTVGLVAIAATMLLYDKQTLFPGWSAVLPVAGSVAVIAGCKHHATVVGRLLSTWPMVKIGKMSYSIYLWHWPLLAFANLLLVRVTLEVRLVLALCSVLISIPSYHFVEQTFRRSTRLSAPRHAMLFAVAVIASTLVVSAITLKSDGFPERLDSLTRTMVDDFKWTGAKYENPDRFTVPLGIDRESSGPVDFFLWGDSHARVMAHVFDDVAATYGLHGETSVSSGTIPVPGLWRQAPMPGSTRIEQLEKATAVKDHIFNSKVDSVILISRWAVYCNGRSEIEVHEGRTKFDTLVVDQELEWAATPQTSAAAIRRQLRKLLEELTARGINVWVFHQVPECECAAPARDFLKTQLTPWLNSTTLLDADKIRIERHFKNQKLANATLSSVAMPGVVFVDVTDECFDENGLLDTYSKRSHYRDDDHLTRYGASKFLGHSIRAVLGQVRDAKVAAEGRAERAE